MQDSGTVGNIFWYDPFPHLEKGFFLAFQKFIGGINMKKLLKIGALFLFLGTVLGACNSKDTKNEKEKQKC